MKEERFALVGIRPVQEREASARDRRSFKGLPAVQMLLLTILLLGCLFCEGIMTKDPAYMDLVHCSEAPGREFLFGTDTLGRDIFSMIWYGGRISLSIGFLSAAISTAIAVVFGAVSGLAPAWLDSLLMRFTEIFLSIPNLLLVLLLQAALGEPNPVSIAAVIGVTSWTGIAKVVRTEVLQIRNSEYVSAARCMGGGFFYILWRHLAPNFLPSILFMIVMNIRSAIVAESTLSFLGIGLPLEVISWGSMLSLSERALLGGSWWMILIPGAFLAGTLVCVTDIGNALRRSSSRRHSNL